MAWNDLVELAGAPLVTVGGDLPVVNPSGDTPVFLSITSARLRARASPARTDVHPPNPPNRYLLARYSQAPIRKRLPGSCLCFSARSRSMVSFGNTPSISASLSGMALLR
jgi:hypothetical protein